MATLILAPVLSALIKGAGYTVFDGERNALVENLPFLGTFIVGQWHEDRDIQ